MITKKNQSRSYLNHFVYYITLNVFLPKVVWWKGNTVQAESIKRQYNYPLNIFINSLQKQRTPKERVNNNWNTSNKTNYSAVPCYVNKSTETRRHKTSTRPHLSATPRLKLYFTVHKHRYNNFPLYPLLVGEKIYRHKFVQ